MDFSPCAIKWNDTGTKYWTNVEKGVQTAWKGKTPAEIWKYLESNATSYQCKWISAGFLPSDYLQKGFSIARCHTRSISWWVKSKTSIKTSVTLVLQNILTPLVKDIFLKLWMFQCALLGSLFRSEKNIIAAREDHDEVLLARLLTEESKRIRSCPRAKDHW